MYLCASESDRESECVKEKCSYVSERAQMHFTVSELVSTATGERDREVISRGNKRNKANEKEAGESTSSAIRKVNWLNLIQTELKHAIIRLRTGGEQLRQ